MLPISDNNRVPLREVTLPENILASSSPTEKKIQVPTQLVISSLFSVKTSQLVLQYLGNLSNEVIENFENIEKLSKGITLKLGKQTAEAVSAKICIFIQMHKKEWEMRIKQSSQSLFIPSSKDCPRSLQYNTDGTVLIHFNSKKKGDPLIGKGRSKNVKLALECTSFTWYATSGIDNRNGNGDEEVAAFQKVRGIPQVIQLLYSVSYTNKKGILKTRLITPFYPDGTLLEECQKEGSWDRKCTIAVQLIRAVTTLHSHGLLHRDIKPENIFIGDQVILGDIGSICETKDLESRRKFRSTSWWVSPELAKDILNKKSLRQSTDEALDIWAVGCVILDLWMELKNKRTNLPWAKSTATHTFQLLAGLPDNNLLFPEPERKDTVDYLMWKMLRVAPKDRISSKELAKEIEVCS